MNIQPTSLDAYKLMHDGVLALAHAERQGIRCDVKYIENRKILLTKKINRLEGQLRDSKFYRHWKHSSKSKINIYSDTQLRTFLYSIKKLKPTKTTTSGKGSTDEEALLALNIPELNVLIQIRKLQKIRDTYLGGFLREQVNGIIHTSFNLHLVKTFRSSSDRPNIQNIPIRDEESMQITRQALFPRPGHQLLEIDYSGLEVRIAACYHKDPTMIKYLEDGFDMHADMAKQIFMINEFDKNIPEHSYLRAAAKNGFVFPEFYGDYYRNCAEGMACNWGKLPYGRWESNQGVNTSEGSLGAHMISKGVKSLDDFTDHIQEIEKDFWGNRFREYARWKKRWWRDYQKTGFIKMKTGFTCSGVMGMNDCINHPIQGAAFHCLLWAFIELDKIMCKEKWQSRLIGQIHDDIIFDIHPPELKMVLRMAQKITCEELPRAWDWINVPLTIDAEVCDVDVSWADKKKIEIT